VTGRFFKDTQMNVRPYLHWILRYRWIQGINDRWIRNDSDPSHQKVWETVLVSSPAEPEAAERSPGFWRSVTDFWTSLYNF